MFCGQCGAELQAGYKICPQCGKRIGEDRPPAPASTPKQYESFTASVAEIPVPSPDEPPIASSATEAINPSVSTELDGKPKNTNKILLGAAIALALIVVALVIAFVVVPAATSGSQSEQSSAETTSTASTSEASSNDQSSSTTGSSTAASDSDYIIPGSDSRYVEYDDLYGLSDRELWLARNEIYARHGRGFNNDELQEYFDSQSWYEKVYEPDEFPESKLFNKYEKANVEEIKHWEAKRDSPYLK